MKSKFLTLAVAAMLAVSAGAVLAQDEKALSPAVVQQLDLINRLVALGDARKDPLLLLAAASIQKSLGTDAAVTLPSQSTAPDAILARAKAFSIGRKDLMDLAEDVGAIKAKGASWRIDAVTGRSTYRH